MSLLTAPALDYTIHTPLLDRVLAILEGYAQASNEQALSRIVPPPMILSQRHITRVRLLKMQAEFASSAESISQPVASEVEVGGNQ